MYKYEEIKNNMLNDITSLPPHTKIRSRKALCMKYQVTRTTVDRAITDLVKRGFLYSRVGSGTYVSDQTKKATITYWGVILPGIVNQVYPKILEGIEKFSASKNINIIICNSDNNAEKEFSHISRLIKSDISGYIIVPCIYPEPDYNIYKILQGKVPFVFCNRYVDGVKAPYISSNNFYGGYLATKYLIKKGADKIAYISNKRYKSSIERLGGYYAALENEGIPINKNLILIDYEDENTIKELIKTQKPNAIFAFNDTDASVVYAILDSLGLKVGKDIKLMGYDDSPICNMLPVKLTSVSYMAYEIGYRAASVLYQMQKSHSYPSMDVMFYQPQIIEREST